MKKRILLILLAILLIASCNDSSRGVLQWAYQFAEEEENYNQSYLGNDGTNIYLERDWDIYKAYSEKRENANGYEIRYEKILESSTLELPSIIDMANSSKISGKKLYKFLINLLNNIVL